MSKSSRSAVMGTLSAALAVVALLIARPVFAQAQDSDDPFAGTPAPPSAPPSGPAEAPPTAAPAAPPPPPPMVQAPAPDVAAPPMAPLPPPPPYPPPPLYAPPQPPQVAAPRSPQLFEPEGPVASWEPLRFAVTVEGRATRPLQDGAKRLAGEKWPAGGGLAVHADVWRPSDRLAVRLDLGWTNTKSASYQPGSSLREELETDLLQLGASVRFHLVPWLAPYARLSGGLGRDKLAVGLMKDRQWFGQGAAGAGVFLRSPSLRLWQGSLSPLLGLVGSLEGGYTLATSSDFSVQASLPSSSENPIPTNEVALGHVGRSAPYVRASFGLAF